MKTLNDIVNQTKGKGRLINFNTRDIDLYLLPLFGLTGNIGYNTGRISVYSVFDDTATIDDAGIFCLFLDGEFIGFSYRNDLSRTMYFEWISSDAYEQLGYYVKSLIKIHGYCITVDMEQPAKLWFSKNDKMSF